MAVYVLLLQTCLRHEIQTYLQHKNESQQRKADVNVRLRIAYQKRNHHLQKRGVQGLQEETVVNQKFYTIKTFMKKAQRETFYFFYLKL